MMLRLFTSPDAPISAGLRLIELSEFVSTLVVTIAVSLVQVVESFHGASGGAFDLWHVGLGGHRRVGEDGPGW